MIRRPPRSTRVRSSAASDVYKRQMDERSTSEEDAQFSDNNDDDDDVRGGQIEGYNSPSSSSSSQRSTSPSKGRRQRKDGDDQLDDDDFERILSRTTARRLLALFEGTVSSSTADNIDQSSLATGRIAAGQPVGGINPDDSGLLERRSAECWKNPTSSLKSDYSRW